MATLQNDPKLLSDIDDAIKHLQRAREVVTGEPYQGRDPNDPCAATDSYLEWLQEIDTELSYSASWHRSAANRVNTERAKAV